MKRLFPFKQLISWSVYYAKRSNPRMQLNNLEPANQFNTRNATNCFDDPNCNSCI